MISPSGNFKLYLASKPVDFRKGMDGLAAIVMNEFDLDPFSGAIFIFRSKVVDDEGEVEGHKSRQQAFKSSAQQKPRHAVWAIQREAPKEKKKEKGG